MPNEIDIINVRITVGGKYYFVNARPEYHPKDKGIIGINTEGNETRAGELIAIYNPKTTDTPLMEFMLKAIKTNLEKVIS